MSLAIDVRMVKWVLLADGWHEVAGGSFELDAYEYVDKDMGEDRPVFSGAQVNGVPSTGATWKEPGGAIVTCPITAILAVKRKSGVRTKAV